MDEQCFVYIMTNRRNGTIYIGSTNDLIRRACEHRNGVVDGFTRKYDCRLLVWYEVRGDLESARVREVRMKVKGDWVADAFTLQPHPQFAGRAVRSITVTATREGDGLSLVYRLTGALDDVLWPAPAEAAFRDELWRHSCCEAFVAPHGAPGYVELNIAPSTEWAAYAFDGPRAGMRRAKDAVVREAVWLVMPEAAELRATAILPDLTGASWDVALTAVIEERDGTKSYWALAHAPGPPDFHNRDCFTARLAAPSHA